MSGINRAHDARVSRRGARRTHGPRDRKPPRDKPGPTRRKADSSSLEHVSRLTKMLAAAFFPRGNGRIVARGRAFPLQLAPPKKPNEHASSGKRGTCTAPFPPAFVLLFLLSVNSTIFYFLLPILLSRRPLLVATRLASPPRDAPFLLFRVTSIPARRRQFNLVSSRLRKTHRSGVIDVRSNSRIFSFLEPIFTRFLEPRESTIVVSGE